MTGEKHGFPLRIYNINTTKFFCGMLLVALGVLMPYILNVYNFGVMRLLYCALHFDESGYMIMAAIRLITLNSIRGVPHYLGAFFIAESLEFNWRGKRSQMPNSILLILMIRCVYWIIYSVHSIQYDFGFPAVMVVILLIVFDKLNYRYVDPLKKALLLALWLTAFQFLDAMPAVENLPFGRGETSEDIKLASAVMGTDSFLNFFTAIGFFIFIAMGVLVLCLLSDENHLLEINALREQNQKIKLEAQLSEMKNRNYSEMQHLVHDLKSPLTSMQTLIGVLKMKCDREKRQNDYEMLSRMETAIEQMSGMISDILHPGHRQKTRTQDLVAIVLAQVSTAKYALYIKTENRAENSIVLVNRIMFTRAVVNLLENAAAAVEERGAPEIQLLFERREHNGADYIAVVVTDNGTGIPEGTLKKIWDKGYSGHKSHGLGLAFVRDVIERAHGEVRVSSRIGEGTIFTILLPEEDKNDGAGYQNTDN